MFEKELMAPALLTPRYWGWTTSRIAIIMKARVIIMPISAEGLCFKKVSKGLKLLKRELYDPDKSYRLLAIMAIPPGKQTGH